MKRKRWFLFIFRLLLFTSVISVFILCFTIFIMQTNAKKNIDVSQMEIKLVDVALQEKIPIEKFKGQVSKVVYLTFDDGPNESTNQILDILKKE